MYNALATPGLLMADSAGVLFEALLSLMGRLRGEGGCPWDREQTRASLKPYLIEETYEAIEALGEGRTDHIVEELDRKSTRLNSSHIQKSRMPSSA